MWQGDMGHVLPLAACPPSCLPHSGSASGGLDNARPLSMENPCKAAVPAWSVQLDAAPRRRERRGKGVVVSGVGMGVWVGKRQENLML